MGINPKTLSERVQKLISAQPQRKTAQSTTPPAKPKIPVAKEGELVKACLAVLKANGVFAWRCNTGAAKFGNHFVRFGMPGISDILGVLPGGRFLAIECKRVGNKPSPAQESFLNEVAEHGGCAIVAYDVDDVMRLFKHE